MGNPDVTYTGDVGYMQILCIYTRRLGMRGFWYPQEIWEPTLYGC